MDEAGREPSGVRASADEVADGTLWEEFCDSLKAAGAVVRAGLAGDDLDRAEGYRYLSRLARLALEKYLEHADPSAPTFYRLSHETAKIGCDNPDSLYQNAAIDGAFAYRLRGERGSVSYLGIGAYYGHYGSPGRSGCSGYLEGGDIRIDEHGRFEILLSASPPADPASNWIRLDPDCSMLIVRQNFLDRTTETAASLALERIGADGPPEPLTSARLAGGLRGAAAYVRGTSSLFASWAEGFRRSPNRLVPMDPKVTGGAHGDPNIFFLMGWWELDEDEALVLEVRPPDCEYWNFQLNNVWMESLDYRWHPVTVNRHTAVLEEDGTLRLVVASRDEGFSNWIDTAGHRRGTMGLRWVKASGHPVPEARVVQRADAPRGSLGPAGRPVA